MTNPREHSQVLIGLIEPLVKGRGYELVELEYQREQGGWVLRLYIDRPGGDPFQKPVVVEGSEAVQGGVSLGDCAEVSREVSAVLDVEDPLEGHYTLEVSSPGLDRPLRWERDFARFAGRKARIRLRDPVDGRKNFAGELRGCTEGRVTIEVDGRPFELPLEAIAKAHLEYEF
jgi:ribosome maturation factor RimP